MGRRPRDDVNFGSGDFADGGVCRAWRTTPRCLASSSTCSASAPRPAYRRARPRAISSRRRCLSHGDTKQILLIPGTPEECYAFAMDAFDLAERLQTLVFVMSDLDLGMNTWMAESISVSGQAARPWQASRRSRRCSDSVGSGGATRTLTATASRTGRCRATACRPYFTRGSGHNERGQYSERPDDYSRNVDRLARKFETVKQFVPAPVVDDVDSDIGIIGYGSSHCAIDECRDQLLGESGIETGYLRIRAYPFPTVRDFVARYRPGLRRRAEPRRADAVAAEDGSAAGAERQAAQRAALQRPADRRPVTDRRDPRAGRQEIARGCRPSHSCRRRRRRKTIGLSPLTWTRRPTASGSSHPYRGGKTTLCAGCGHNAISERIIEAFFEMGIDPRSVIKLSGIGCSSKSPAYFLGGSHGFNTVHGRMPSVGTGAMLANRKLIAIGVSGDGDTGAIGIGQFVHLMRRNLPIIYIIEDNGCYGLTKGQFSPTADLGSKPKNGVANELPPIDTCTLAIELGASFVARSFSGDKKQLLSILKASLWRIAAPAMIDVISPCVTFNDHEGSTKSYAYAKDHDEVIGEVSFVPFFEDISVDYDPGTTTASRDARRLEAVSEEGRRGLQPDRQAGGAAAAARDRQPRRVRDRRALRRARQGRFRLAARSRRRAAGDPAARAVRPGQAVLDEVMESFAECGG